MSSARILLVLIAAAALPGCGAAAPVVVPAGGSGSLESTSPGEASWALEVLDLTNARRAEHGLPPLALDAAASDAAYAHCWDMDLRSFFDHVDPDGNGPEERLLRHGVEFRDARENIGRGQRTPAEVVEAWMASPNHRANILFPGWTSIGVAVHSGSPAGPWWAQEFFR